MDHRCGVRIAVDAPVLLIYPAHAASSGWMTEVSMSGAFVRTDFAPPELVWIHIAGPFEETEACVVRHNTHGIAIEWDEYLPLPIRALVNANQKRGASSEGVKRLPMDVSARRVADDFRSHRDGHLAHHRALMGH
jgi:hypothetical protein